MKSASKPAKAPAYQNAICIYCFFSFFDQTTKRHNKLNSERGCIREASNRMYFFVFVYGGGANKWGSLLAAVYGRAFQ